MVLLAAGLVALIVCGCKWLYESIETLKAATEVEEETNVTGLLDKDECRDLAHVFEQASDELTE